MKMRCPVCNSPDSDGPVCDCGLQRVSILSDDRMESGLTKFKNVFGQLKPVNLEDKMDIQKKRY